MTGTISGSQSQWRKRPKSQVCIMAALIFRCLIGDMHLAIIFP